MVADEAAGGIGEVTADAHIPEDPASRGVEAGDPGGPRVHRNDDLLGVDLRPAAGAQTLHPRAVERQPCGVDVIGDEGRCEISIQRSEEHTSELQSLMRISYAVFCLKKKNQ